MERIFPVVSRARGAELSGTHQESGRSERLRWGRGPESQSAKGELIVCCKAA